MSIRGGVADDQALMRDGLRVHLGYAGGSLTQRYGTTMRGRVLEPGTITGFVGANGAGKSTTLRMPLGLTRPTSGTATIDGHR